MHGPVIIAGAGLGGLVLALALHARGIPVQVFESVSALRPLGVVHRTRRIGVQGRRIPRASAVPDQDVLFGLHRAT